MCAITVLYIVMKLWVTIYNELFMGKLKGIIQLTGKFDGLSFYEMWIY